MIERLEESWQDWLSNRGDEGARGRLNRLAERCAGLPLEPGAREVWACRYVEANRRGDRQAARVCLTVLAKCLEIEVGGVARKRRSVDHPAAQDLLQSARVALLTHGPDQQQEKSAWALLLGYWVRTIENEATSAERGARRTVPFPDEGEGLDLKLCLENAYGSTEAGMGLRNVSRVLNQEGYSEEEIEIFVRAAWGEHQREIGDRFGKSQNAVAQLVCRMRKRLLKLRAELDLATGSVFFACPRFEASVDDHGLVLDLLEEGLTSALSLDAGERSLEPEPVAGCLDRFRFRLEPEDWAGTLTVVCGGERHSFPALQVPEGFTPPAVHQRVALARWLVQHGAGRAVSLALEGIRGSEANKLRLAAAQVRLGPGVFTLAVHGGQGFVLPLGHPIDGPSQAADEGVRGAVDLGVGLANREVEAARGLARGALKPVHFQLESWEALHGESIGLAAALAAVAPHLPDFAEKRVVATGRLEADGTVAAVDGLPEKLAALARESCPRGAVVLVPPGGEKSLPPLPAGVRVSGVRDLAEALREVAGWKGRDACPACGSRDLAVGYLCPERVGVEHCFEPLPGERFARKHLYVGVAACRQCGYASAGLLEPGRVSGGSEDRVLPAFAASRRTRCRGAPDRSRAIRPSRCPRCAGGRLRWGQIEGGLSSPAIFAADWFSRVEVLACEDCGQFARMQAWSVPGRGVEMQPAADHRIVSEAVALGHDLRLADSRWVVISEPHLSIHRGPQSRALLHVCVRCGEVLEPVAEQPREFREPDWRWLEGPGRFVRR